MQSLGQRMITLCVMLICNFVLTPAFAHDGYLTTYDHHIKKGEVEMMFFLDYTSPSKFKREEDGRKEYFSQMLELKYNPSDRLALEFMLEGFQDVGTGKGKFTGFRYETRYRLFKKELWLNPMLYAEYEDLDLETRFKMEVSGWVNPPYDEGGGEEPDREKILETRLILSRDFGAWNVALNWINESDFNTGVTAFGYSTGARYTLHLQGTKGHVHHGSEDAGEDSLNSDSETNGKYFQPASLAFEFFGALGDSKKFGVSASRQEHYFQPSIMFHLGQRKMLTLGFAFGLSRASDDMARLQYGWKY